MEPLVVIALSACFVTTLAIVISKTIGKEEEMERLSQEIKRYNRLSMDAEKLGQQEVYAAFQKKGNETLHKYFSALFCEAVTEIFPHVLAMGIFQHVYGGNVVNFGFNIWLLGDGLGVITIYIISALAFYFGILRRIRGRIPLLKKS